MTKHTPGPWHIERRRIPDTTLVQVNIVAANPVKEHHIEVPAHVDLRVAFTGGCEGRGEANAHLIAAAPELLAACKELSEYWRHGTPVNPGSYAASHILAAIARAEGRS